MICSRVRDLLPDYSVQILDGRTTREVAAHLGTCEECAAELHAQEEAVRLVEQFGGINPPPGLFNAVRNRIEAGDFVRERPAWWAFLNTRPARVAAMGMAMAAVVLGLTLPTGHPDHLETPIFINGPGISQSAENGGDLTNSIRQHAISAGAGSLTDRVAWEAMAQIVTQNEKDEKANANAPGKKGDVLK
jgi:hypothetical protein